MTKSIEIPEAIRHRCKNPDDPHVVMAMSGGVDSSVAALLLKRSGIRVSGVFMKNWNEPDDDGRCQWESDVEDVLSVCDAMEIPVNTVDLSDSYWDSVFEEFLTEYKRGRTPNPDVLCNREVKFKAFAEYAADLGADFVATGHYAQIAYQGQTVSLHKGADPGKDQTYFLYAVEQHALQGALFPIGDMDKQLVRKIARDANLDTAAKKDSTGICFIGERRFRQFMREYLPLQPGEIRDVAGRTIGQHQGAAFYTLGQREGLGIGGVRGQAEGPWYVVDKNVDDNVLTAAQGHDHPMLMSSSLVADNLHWISGNAPTTPFECMAKSRYRQPDQVCRIVEIRDGRAEIEFSRPQRAVTPGQSIVFYSRDNCLGGGIIDQTWT